MQKLLFALSFSLLLMGPARAQEKGLDRYVVLPEKESHLYVGAPKARELEAESIKALIWNIKKTQEDGWQKEFLEYSKGRDLVLLQEAHKNYLFNSTILFLDGLRWDMGISFLFKKQNNTPTGTMIGSAADPQEVLVRHSPDFEPVTETPKTITFAKYAVEGRGELLVVSVHGINFVTTGAFKRQMDMAAKEMASHFGPILFAGDFNTWTEARTRHLFAIARGMGLKEVQFKNGEHRKKFSGNYLDHAFVRGVIVKKAEVIAESKGSDHRPMLIEVQVP